jgi:hypothetical protein
MPAKILEAHASVAESTQATARGRLSIPSGSMVYSHSSVGLRYDNRSVRLFHVAIGGESKGAEGTRPIRDRYAPSTLTLQPEVDASGAEFVNSGCD